MIPKNRMLALLALLTGGLLLAGCMGDGEDEVTDDTQDQTADDLNGDAGTDNQTGATNDTTDDGGVPDAIPGLNDTHGAEPPTPYPPQDAATPG